MNKYENVAQDSEGNVIENATVTVKEYPGGANATIYSANSTAGGNVNGFLTGEDGSFEFFAANGRYNVEISKPGRTTKINYNILIQDLSSSDGSSLVGFLQSGTGAVSRTVQAKERDIIHVNDFNPTADGTTDDLIPLTNFINAVLASPSRRGYMDGSKTYATSGSLPTINVSGVQLIGGGPSSNHDIAASPTINGTCIKAIAGCTGTMLTVSPTSGAGNQRLDGIKIDGIAFNCGQIAAKGLTIKSVRNSFFNVYAEDANTTCYDLGVVAALGDARDLQDCTFHLYGQCVFTTGNVLQLNGDSGANVSLNRFEIVDLVHKGATAIVTVNPDSNYWGTVRVYRTAGGTATNSIEWRGGATLQEATRSEYYNVLVTTVAAIAKGTSTYTVGAQNIFIASLNVENATPDPTIETGATVRWMTSDMKFNLLTVLGAITATGGQITFPATQVPSSNVNTLDDYEEGTWTPVLTFGTPGNLSVTYSTQVGVYRKIGGLVVASFSIVTSAFTHTTASGNALVTGLPFTAITATGMENIGAISWSGITKASYTNVVGAVPSADSRVTLVASGSGASRATVTAADMPTAGAVILTGTVCYPAA